MWSPLKYLTAFHIFYCCEQTVRCLSDSWKLNLVICSPKELTFKLCCVLGVVTLRILNAQKKDTSWLVKTAAHSSICQTRNCTKSLVSLVTDEMLLCDS